MANKKSPKTKQGYFFVFEGPDGVGKSSIVRKVARCLEDKGEKVLFLGFPGNVSETLGNLIYSLHHEPKKYNLKDISASSLQTLHIAAHIDSIENQIIPALTNGTTVLLDRYWWSTFVYGTANGVAEKALISMIKLEKHFWKEVLPNIAFLITNEKPYRKELSLQEWKDVCNSYNQLSVQESKYYPVENISNSGSIDETTKLVMKLITSTFGKKMSTNKSVKSKKVHFKRDKWFPTKTTKAFDSYWYLAAERQEVFFKRANAEPAPWTNDPIIREYKFTNAYRASDRVSQFLIKNVIYKGKSDPKELFFRIILFKIFNKIETWLLLKEKLGEILYSEYDFDRYDKILTEAKNAKKTIYSAAYIMPSGGNCFGFNYKHRNNLKLIEHMMLKKLPAQIKDSKSMQNVFDLLRDCPMIGDFLAYQYAIDINYSELTNFNEMSFVVPGPGAKNGLRKCFSDFGGLSEVDLIMLVAERQEEEFQKRKITFKNLWGRPLQLIDCQNLFCEVDKYSRIAHPEIKGINDRTKIKQKYKTNNKPIQYYYPPKWGINEEIKNEKT